MAVHFALTPELRYQQGFDIYDFIEVIQPLSSSHHIPKGLPAYSQSRWPGSESRRSLRKLDVIYGVDDEERTCISLLYLLG